MFKYILVIAFLLFPSFAIAEDVSSAVQEEFEIKASYKDVCKFIESHSDEIIKSANNKILSRDGDKVKIQSLNRQEEIILTIQEFSSDGKYSSKMVKSHVGGLKSQSTTITVTDGKKGKTHISLRIEATIDNPIVSSPFELRVGINKSAQGIKNYLRKKL